LAAEEHIPSLEIPVSATSSMLGGSVILSCVIWTLLSSQAIIMASKDPKIGKQGAAGERKHVT
jgi:hypothetical protein